MHLCLHSAATARRLLFTAIVLGCAVSGCAIPSPPEPSPLPDLAAPLAQALRPSLRMVEGQPRGLLLELKLPQEDPTSVDTLVLLRQATPGPQDFVPLIEFTPKAHPKLWNTGQASFLDADLTEAHSYRYTLVTKRDGAYMSRSDLKSITWQAPPPEPSGLKAEVTGRHIELTWIGQPDLGYQVFRRQIGKGRHTRPRPPQRPGEPVLIDIPPKQGAVYGYLISQVRWQDGLPLIGAPSAELYVDSTTAITAPKPSVTP